MYNLFHNLKNIVTLAHRFSKYYQMTYQSIKNIKIVGTLTNSSASSFGRYFLKW